MGKKIFFTLSILVITKLGISQNTSFTLPNWTTKVVTDNVMYMESATTENILYKSTDQGASIDSLTKFNYISNLYFYNEDNGFVVGNTGELFKTSDGGQNWDTLNLPADDRVNDINCFHENTCLISMDNDSIFKTIDGGVNWSATNHPSINDCDNIEINSNGKALFIESDGRSKGIYISSDFGNNWTYGGRFSGSSANFSLMDNGNIIAMNPYSSDIKVSSDNGNSWDIKSIAFEKDQYLYSLNDNSKYAVAACSTSTNLILLCSDDFGQSWQRNNFSDQLKSIYNVQITPGNVVYTFGENWAQNSISGYRSYGNVSCFSTAVYSDEITSGVELVYPNPSTAIFSFDVDFKGSYSIFDISGKKILSSKELSFDLSDQKAGFYFIQYEVEGALKTQKIIKK